MIFERKLSVHLKRATVYMASSKLYMKKVSLTRLYMARLHYVLFQERQNYCDRQHIGGFQGLSVGVRGWKRLE